MWPYKPPHIYRDIPPRIDWSALIAIVVGFTMICSGDYLFGTLAMFLIAGFDRPWSY